MTKKRKWAKQDPHQISWKQRHEIDYVFYKFRDDGYKGLTRKIIIDAVKYVGPGRKNTYAYLRKQYKHLLVPSEK